MDNFWLDIVKTKTPGDTCLTLIWDNNAMVELPEGNEFLNGLLEQHGPPALITIRGKMLQTNPVCFEKIYN